MTKPVSQLPDDLRREIIDHCLAELPNEACGLLAVAKAQVMAVYPARNLDESPSSYTIDPADHFSALTDAEAHGWDLGGVYHSHPNGPAEMSSVDVERALDPDWVYVVVGLGGPIPTLGLYSGRGSR